jgi:hypothetical protein
MSASLATLSAVANDPIRKGERASEYVTFGPFKRYGVAALHTRFDAVQWFVWDVELLDQHSGEYGRVIRQEDTLEAALRGLDTVDAAV